MTCSFGHKTVIDIRKSPQTSFILCYVTINMCVPKHIQHSIYMPFFFLEYKDTICDEMRILRFWNFSLSLFVFRRFSFIHFLVIFFLCEWAPTLYCTVYIYLVLFFSIHTYIEYLCNMYKNVCSLWV